MRYYYRDKYSMQPVGLEHLDLLAEHRNDFDTWRNLSVVLPVWKERQKDWLASLGDKNLYFVGHKQDIYKPISFLRLTDIDFQNSNACVGLDIFRRFRGQGYAKPFFTLVCEYAFEVLNLHRLWLLVREDNERAINVYLEEGFMNEGRMKEHLYREGRYYDYILMGKIR